MNHPILSVPERRHLKQATRQAYYQVLDKFESVRPAEYVRTIQEVYPDLDAYWIRDLFNRRFPQQLTSLVECIKILNPDFEFPQEAIQLTKNAA